MRTCYKEIMPNDPAELRKHLQSALELIDEIAEELNRCKRHKGSSLGSNIGGMADVLKLRRESLHEAIEKSPVEA